jgi:2-oxoglutarate dehydrogenase E1 component
MSAHELPSKKPESAGRASPDDDLPSTAEIEPANLEFIEALYLRWCDDSNAVPPAWQPIFAAWQRGEPPTPTANHSPGIAPGSSTHNHTIETAAVDRARGDKRIRRLIEDYREHGHMSADLDPLGLEDRSRFALRIEDYGLEDADLDAVIKSDVAGLGTAPLRSVIEHLKATYCGHIGVELAHIYDTELRSWLQERVEDNRNQAALGRSERFVLLARAIEAEVFEQFLQTKFLGAKRFSLEGAESAIPLLDRIIDRAASQGVTQIIIGMPHRGRLNVLANVLRKPPAEIFAEFLDRMNALNWDPGGDVKYHLGYSSDRVSSQGKVHVSLAFNPSHLEAVDTVVQGRVRAKQDRMKHPEPETRGLPILIHGDAAFAGQGIVYEAFNMSGLPGYRVGGTIHLVVNNRIGFTTPPERSTSFTYPTDAGRMLQVPVLHINGEDPEAVAQAVDIAVDFRQRFHRDVIIDMWCYRKLGHNEGDEPSYTQPLMYRRIKSKRPVRDAYVQAFANRGNGNEAPITLDDADAISAAKFEELERALESAKRFEQPPIPSTFAGVWSRIQGGTAASIKDVVTAVPRDTIESIGKGLSTVPETFTPHPKLVKLLQTRLEMALGQRSVDWGMGEALAYGSLLLEGTRVRLSGQDVRRGTFSHRHATLTDFNTGEDYTSLAHLSPEQARIDIYDSPLSEEGVLGFEYGYSLDTPDGLVIWEAQFGDFVNGAQVIIDQFLMSSEAKWRRVSGLTLLLPHGMEGQGPEHSSARLERFLNMCVNDNIQVCNVTTPAQFFHLMRRQVLRPYRKPLIVMSPKSLLRHPLCVSEVSDFTDGAFAPIVPDRSVDPAKVDRIVLCSGKVYYDLLAARDERGLGNVAILRIEELYPTRMDILLEELSVYRDGIPCVWVQEEPRNMGPWTFVQRYYRPLLVGNFQWSSVTRPQSSSPATGSGSRHKLEHARLMKAALGLVDANVASTPEAHPVSPSPLQKP